MGCAHHWSLCSRALSLQADMWQQNERLWDEISIKVDLTAKFTGLLYCNRTDETDKETGRERDTETERVERIQTDDDRKRWPTLGLIKLPLLALIERERNDIEHDSGEWSLQLK